VVSLLSRRRKPDNGGGFGGTRALCCVRFEDNGGPNCTIDRTFELSFTLNL